MSPDRRVLYVGYRGTPAIESCRIDSSSGALTSLGRVSTEHPPTYLATAATRHLRATEGIMPTGDADWLA